MKKVWISLLLLLTMLLALPLSSYAATDETNFEPFKLKIVASGMNEGAKRLLVKKADFPFDIKNGGQLAGCTLNGSVTYQGSGNYSKVIPFEGVVLQKAPDRTDDKVNLEFYVPAGYKMEPGTEGVKAYTFDLTIAPKGVKVNVELPDLSEQPAEQTPAQNGSVLDFEPIKLTVKNNGQNAQKGTKRLVIATDKLPFEVTTESALAGCLLNGKITYTGKSNYTKEFTLENVVLLSAPLRTDGNVNIEFSLPAGVTMDAGSEGVSVYKFDLTLSPAPKTADDTPNNPAQPQKTTVDVNAMLATRPNTEIAVLLNGEWLTFDVEPMLVNDRTMVPFRAIFEKLNCTVSWNESTETAVGIRNGLKVSLPIGSTTVMVGEQKVTLDVPAMVHNDRTLVPLRFVSEALGATVEWLDESQTVVINAEIPVETILLTPKSFSDAGSWRLEELPTGSLTNMAYMGLTAGGQGATVEDADTSQAKPASATFYLAEGGTYRVWGRSKDFPNQNPGVRFYNVQFNDQPMMPHKYGTHGKQGYAWATGGTVELPAGKNTLYLHDTSGFYARCDAILITKDLDFVPSEDYGVLSKTVLPLDNGIEYVAKFPSYANEQNAPTDSISIENEYTKVVFYKVPTSKGQVIQNEIYSKHNGAWVKTNNRDEELGYLVLGAEEADAITTKDTTQLKARFTLDGMVINKINVNPYDAGYQYWYIPTDYTLADNNTVVLTFPATEAGTLTVAWSVDGERYPKVSIDATFAKEGYYTIGAWEGKGMSFDEFDYALAPYRVMFKRVDENPELYAENYMFTPMGTYTLKENNKYNALPVTKGFVVEPGWAPNRWVYKENSLFGVTMNDAVGKYRGTVFAPLLGKPESKMNVGSTYNLQLRMVSHVGDWFDSYSYIARELYDVTDYRKHYTASLNDVVFNVRDLVLDPVYGGWDDYSKAHWNKEGINATSSGNPMQYLQDYLLTEDEEMLTKRAIPTVANYLTRKTIHFNRTDKGGGLEFWGNQTDPAPIGTPISGFNANVVGGMYEMTRGQVPFLHEYALEKGQAEVTNAYGNIAPFANDLTLYKYTGEQKYLDRAIATADKYLEEVVYADDTKTPTFESFVYIAYFPNLASLMDIYEVTKEQRYLDAAEFTAQWISTSLWVPGVEGTRKTDPLMVNDISTFKDDNIWGVWYAGEKQFRIGRENDIADTTTDVNITSRMREVEGWIPARVGLGTEQASTFLNSKNIIMQCFAGDFMRLSVYTGNDYYATAARNAMIGRFRSYEGYSYDTFMTYQLEEDYPREGPDFTSIFWHHLPPYLAMVEDFLINQAFAWSGTNISFPGLRQQGYAYFNSNQYGHAAGKFYDQNDMWLWIDKGIVETDSIQLDWVAARKDGVLGVALMNEDPETLTTTVKLGDKVPGGATFNGTADLYDKTGKIGTVDIVNGAFTLTIPSKTLQAIVVNIDAVKAPAFSKVEYSNTSANVGATRNEFQNGGAYTLQVAPDWYYAYVYITDKPAQVKSLTIKYTVNGETKSETYTQYPFEFIIKVDDVNADFNYTLTAAMTDGTTQEVYSGRLMANAKSNAQGEKFQSDKVEVADFEPFKMEYLNQGSKDGNMRFAAKVDQFPFEVTENSLAGLKVTGIIIDGDKRIPFETKIVGNEMRAEGKMIVIMAPSGEFNSGNYLLDDGKAHRFEMTISK